MPTEVREICLRKRSLNRKLAVAAGGSRQPLQLRNQQAQHRSLNRSAEPERLRTEEEFSEEDLADARDPASFVSFMMSIASNAASALGMMEHPVTHQREVDVELGKHWIDVLGMLQKKTAGNLTPQEKRMLEGLLADLRMQYVSLVNSPQQARKIQRKRYHWGEMKLTFLGTGTSTGVPSIGCECETCVSDDPRDKRLRVSIIIEHAGRTVLVDTSADFDNRRCASDLKHLDAVLITHCHADHIFGLDDIRPLNFRFGALGVYANERAWVDIKRIFKYIFEPSHFGGGLPEVIPNTVIPGASFCLGKRAGDNAARSDPWPAAGDGLSL